MQGKLWVFAVLTAVLVVPAVAAAGPGHFRRNQGEQERKMMLEKRDEAQKMREEIKEKMQTRREELEDKLPTIRDTRRKQVVEKLHDRMCNVQQNRVAAQKRQLASLTNILNRVEDRANGDPAVAAAISAAKEAISQAEAAVAALERRDCGLSISGDEARLRGEVRQAQQALSGEVKSVHQKIVLARRVVADAVRALAKALGEPIP